MLDNKKSVTKKVSVAALQQIGSFGTQRKSKGSQVSEFTGEAMTRTWLREFIRLCTVSREMARSGTAMVGIND